MKKPSLHRLVGVLVAGLMIVSMVSFEILDVFAIAPTYTVSSDYKASKYYKNLSALTLTGNARSDVVRVALTQLGYHEGNSTADFGGGNTNGSRNFVEYNRLHGKLDNNEGNGYSYGYYWCAAFATWCAVQARIPNSVVPTDNYVGVSTQRLRAWFMENAKYYSRGTYTPITGDYIFYKDAGAAVPTTHVGLVLYVKDGTVYAIEGNAGGNDCVALKEYSLSNTYIAGYGVPNYATGSTVAIDMTNKSNPGVYLTTASTLAVRSGPGTSYDSLGAVVQATMAEVSEVSGNWGKINYGGTAGWISLSYAIPLSIPTITVQYDANGGTGAPATQGKMPGKPILLSTTVPTRPGYKFLGWSTSATATKALYASGGSYTADQSVKFYAVWEKETYVIQFVNHDGTVLQSKTYEYGDTVTPPAKPTRASDKTYSYTFAEWDKTVQKASAPAVYTAQYQAKYIDYSIIFCDDDNTVLSHAAYHYGDTVAVPPVPTKAADKTYSYTFVGWGAPVTRVTGNQVYTAVYDKTYLDYLVTFADENGVVLSQEMYHYGDTVKQPPAPTKESDAKFDYTFLGWDKQVSPVDGIALYTATYEKSERQYAVTFRNPDGETVAQAEYPYGATVTPPADPTMASDVRFVYTFAGWSANGTDVTAFLPVTEDAVYTAVYETRPVEYTVTFRDESGNVYASNTYHYGDAIDVPNDPVKTATEEFTFRFDGWSETVSSTVIGDVVYVAKFTAEPVEKKPGIDHLLKPGDGTTLPVLGFVILGVVAVGLIALAVCAVVKRKKY